MFGILKTRNLTTRAFSFKNRKKLQIRMKKHPDYLISCSFYCFRAFPDRELCIVVSQPLHHLRTLASNIYFLYIEGMTSKELIFEIFSEFMAKVVKLEELADMGSKSLAGFHQGLEFIRRPSIHKNSSSIVKILKANETKRLLAYVEAGCVKSHDKMESISNLHTCQVGLNDHLSSVKCTVQELESLVQKVTSEILSSNKVESQMENNDTTEFDTNVIANDEEGIRAFESQKPGVTDYATMMSIIFSMVKRDVDMQERIISSLTVKSTSGELESYSLMWSLHPYINDEVMHQALRLIP